MIEFPLGNYDDLRRAEDLGEIGRRPDDDVGHPIKDFLVLSPLYAA